MYIEHVGLMNVVNHKTGHICEVEFKKRGWSAKDHDRVEGKVMDKSGKVSFKLQGKWTEGINAIGLPNSGYPETEIRVWQSNEPPENQPQMYNFTNFTLQLNYLRPGQEHVLPPTDSRFRPDQRALENGELDKASAEKVRLEEKQRARRK
jgi:Oxysterol-binding protein